MGQKLILIVILQIGLMFCVAVPVAHTLLTGKSVILKTVPVDPHDMFRGDYISLRYDITKIPTRRTFESGQEVYVALHRDGNLWVASDVAADKNILALQAGDVMITGKVSYFYRGEVTVQYGIEQVFVKEGTGNNLENTGNMLVTARISDDGRAVISHVKSSTKVIYDARDAILWQQK